MAHCWTQQLDEGWPMQPLASGALFCCTACLTRTRRNSRLSRFCFPGFLRLCGLLRRQSSFFRSHSSLQSMPLPGQIVQESNPRFLHLSPTPSLARRSIQQMARAAAPPQSLPPRPIPPLSSPSALPIPIYEPSAPLPASIIKPSNNSQNYSKTVFHISVSSQSIRPRLQAVRIHRQPPYDGRPVYVFQLQPRRNHLSSLYAPPPSAAILSWRLVYPVKAKDCTQSTPGAPLSAATHTAKAEMQGSAK